MSYTKLFVQQSHTPSALLHYTVAHFQLLICPSRALNMGSRVHLHHILDPSEMVPFVPTSITAPFTAVRLDIWGQVVAVKPHDESELEVMVENWNPHSTIQLAYVRVPWLPGTTTDRDIMRAWVDVNLNAPCMVSVVSNPSGWPTFFCFRDNMTQLILLQQLLS